MSTINIIAISGSTREHSINDSLIHAISDLTRDTCHIAVYKGLINLPQFNPDHDLEDVAHEVADWRKQLKNADGILICTPEYAHGVPGALKNAIDWTISSSEFPHKPTLLITAATDGKFGHAALLETLRTIEAGNVSNLQLVISFAKTKISGDGKITDQQTLKEVTLLLNDFIETIQQTTTNAVSESS